MRRMLRAVFVQAVLVLGAMLPAATARAQGQLLSEVRLGLLAHDVQFGNGPQEGGVDVNLEVLFASPVPDQAVAFAPAPLRWLLQPRPIVGAQINSDGFTSQGYAGADFTAVLFTDIFRAGDALLFDVAEAASLNNGFVDRRDGDDKRLGSNVLFRTSGDVGYRIAPHWAGYIEIDHESNAGLARANQGLTQLGMRLGLSF